MSKQPRTVMRYLTVEQFQEELDEVQLEVLKASGPVHNLMDHKDILKLLEGQCDHVTEIAYGELPSAYGEGHFHFGVRFTVSLKSSSEELKRVRQRIMDELILTGRTQVIIPAPFKTKVDQIIIFDSCDEYSFRSGIERLKIRLLNPPPCLDN